MKLRSLLLTPSAAALLAAPTVLQGQSLWTGSLDSLAGNPANWSGTAPVSGGSASLVFNPANLTGLLITALQNDLTNFTATSISFDNTSTAGALVLAGNQITLGGNITTTGTTGTPVHLISLDLILNGNRTVSTVTSNQITISGIISETGGARNLVKAGTGTLRLEGLNPFSGQVQIDRGTLIATSLADTGTASSLGTGGGNSTIRIGLNNFGGVLRYEGAGANTNRQIQVGNGNAGTATGGATIANFGSGALVFTAPTFNASNETATVARTLVLDGTSTAANEIQGTIRDNSINGGVLNLTKADEGTWRLSGDNLFTGRVTIQAGTLEVVKLSTAGTSSSLGLGTIDPAIRMGTNTSDAALVYTGTSSSETDRSFIFLRNASVANNGTGSITFGSADFNLAHATATARTVTLGGTNTGANTIMGIIRNNDTGSIGLAKSGTGAWRLVNPASTYSGQTAINTGILEVFKLADAGSASSIGDGASNSVIRIGNTTTGGTLAYLGEGDSTNRQIQIGNGATQAGGATIDSSGGGALVFSNPAFNVANTTTGARTLTLSGGNTNTNAIIGAIQNNNTGPVGLIKSGSGLWRLSGLSSTYSGQTILNAGTLEVLKLADAGLASSIGDGNTNTVIRIGNGTITATLAYLGTGDTTNRQVQIGNHPSQGGGAVIESSGSGALVFSNTVFNALNVTTGTRSLTLTGTNPDGNTIAGEIRNNDTGVVNLVKSGNGLWILGGVNTFTGTQAVNGGTLRVAPGSNLSNNAVTVTQGTLDLRVSSQTIGALNLGTAAASGPAALVLDPLTSLITTGNLTLTGNGNGHQSSMTGGALLDVLQAAGTRTWTVQDTAGLEVDLLVSTPLTASAASGNRIFVKAGGGTLELSGANSLTNLPTLRIADGQLRIAATSNLVGVTSLDLRQGVLDLRNPTASFSAITLGNATVGDSNASILLAPGSTLNLDGNLSYLADDTANNAAVVSGGELRLTGARTFTVGDHTGISGPELVISSPIGETGGARLLTKSGSGTLLLGAANTYTGGTSVTAGVLRLGVNQALPATGAVSVNGGASSGVIDFNGTNATVASLVMGNTATTVANLAHSVIDGQGGGVLVLSGNVTYNAGSTGLENGKATIAVNLDLGGGLRTFTVADSPNAVVDLEVSGIVSGNQGVAKAGAGTLHLSSANTFDGQPQINAGRVRVDSLANQGVASGLGTGSLAALIRIGNQAQAGVLEYTGDGDTTNRPIQIGAGTATGHTGGATLLNNGTGPLLFTAANFNTAVNTGTGPAEAGRVLTLGGSNTDWNTISGVIRNNAQTLNPSVNLVKTDGGTWILEGTNLYTGTTRVLRGTLRIDGNQTSATGAVTVASGGTLGGTGLVGGATTVESGGTLTGGAPGGTGTLGFSGNLSLQSGALWLVDLIGDLNGAADLIHVAGTLQLGGAALQFANLGAFTPGHTYPIARYSSLAGSFQGLNQGDLVGGQYLIDYGSGTNGTITLSAVPEPAVLFPMMVLFTALWRFSRYLERSLPPKESGGRHGLQGIRRQ